MITKQSCKELINFLLTELKEDLDQMLGFEDNPVQYSYHEGLARSKLNILSNLILNYTPSYELKPEIEPEEKEGTLKWFDAISYRKE